MLQIWKIISSWRLALIFLKLHFIQLSCKTFCSVILFKYLIEWRRIQFLHPNPWNTPICRVSGSAFFGVRGVGWEGSWSQLLMLYTSWHIRTWKKAMSVPSWVCWLEHLASGIQNRTPMPNPSTQNIGSKYGNTCHRGRRKQPRR